MGTGEGAEEGRGSETIFLLLLPDVGIRPQQQGGLDSAGHMQEREAWPAGQAGRSPHRPARVFQRGAVRVQEAVRACAPGLPLWAEGVVGVLQARLALEGQGAEEGEGRGGVRRGSAPLRRSPPASPARGLPVNCVTHPKRQTHGKGSPPNPVKGGVRSYGMGSERLPGTCPAAP